MILGHVVGEPFAHPDAVDQEVLAVAVVRHREDADGAAALIGREDPRRGADPTLEIEALHPRA